MKSSVLNQVPITHACFKQQIGRLVNNAVAYKVQDDWILSKSFNKIMPCPKINRVVDLVLSVDQGLFDLIDILPEIDLRHWGKDLCFWMYVPKRRCV